MALFTAIGETSSQVTAVLINKSLEQTTELRFEKVKSARIFEFENKKGLVSRKPKMTGDAVEVKAEPLSFQMIELKRGD